jgi:hypothetical protein
MGADGRLGIAHEVVYVDLRVTAGNRVVGHVNETTKPAAAPIIDATLGSLGPALSTKTTCWR